MKITINHTGRTTADVLGVRIPMIEAKTLIVLGRWENNYYRPLTKIYEDIFSPSKLTDMEKIVVFNHVTNILRNEFVVEIGIKKATF